MQRNKNKTLVVILLFGFFFRMLLVPIARHGDINNNVSWGEAIVDRGPVGFYEGKSWEYSAPNQPPLYILLFGSTAIVGRSVQTLIATLNTRIGAFPSPIVWWWDQWGELYLAKLPGILSDLVIGLVIFLYFKKDTKKGILLASVWIANPISWYNSAIWGGTDGIVNMIGLSGIIFLLRRKLTPFLILFSACILFKGSLALFIPLALFVAIKQKHDTHQWVTSLFWTAAFVIATTVLFHPQIDLPVWLFRLYTERFFPGEIGSLSANAFNFWYLIDPGTTLDSTLFFAFPARIWGLLVLLLGYGMIWVQLKKKASDTKILMSFAVLSLVSFLFMTRIHERYMYPFFPVATVLLGFVPWMWLPYLMLSGLHLLNLYHLFWAPGIDWLKEMYLNPQFANGLAILSIVTFGYIIWKARKSL